MAATRRTARQSPKNQALLRIFTLREALDALELVLVKDAPANVDARRVASAKLNAMFNAMRGGTGSEAEALQRIVVGWIADTRHARKHEPDFDWARAFRVLDSTCFQADLQTPEEAELRRFVEARSLDKAKIASFLGMLGAPCSADQVDKFASRHRDRVRRRVKSVLSST